MRLPEAPSLAVLPAIAALCCGLLETACMTTLHYADKLQMQRSPR
jgi:hypothetical protein